MERILHGPAPLAGGRRAHAPRRRTGDRLVAKRRRMPVSSPSRDRWSLPQPAPLLGMAMIGASVCAPWPYVVYPRNQCKNPEGALRSLEERSRERLHSSPQTPFLADSCRPRGCSRQPAPRPSGPDGPVPAAAIHAPNHRKPAPAVGAGRTNCSAATVLMVPR